MNSSAKSLDFEDKAELTRVLEACMERYGSYPNVVGIGAGLKYKENRDTTLLAVHFFVNKKYSKANLQAKKKATLPRFVFARDEKGRINRKKRYLTDVIEVGDARLTCGAGSPLNGAHPGTMTLFFRDKDSTQEDDYYIITCSHVVDGLGGLPKNEIDSDCCGDIKPFARVVDSNSEENSVVNFDIALAKVEADAVAELKSEDLLQDCSITGNNIIFDSFLSREHIFRGMNIVCQTPNSSPFAEVKSINVQMRFKGYSYIFKNLFKIDAYINLGDSGSLVYSDTQAVGIIIGKTDDGAYFQPLEQAVQSLNYNVRVF